MTSLSPVRYFCNDPSCSLSHCTPPVENSKLAAVAASLSPVRHFCNDPSCSLSHCTPPVENSKLAAVAASGADGQGVCASFIRPIVRVWFKCPSFGVNDEGCTLAEWPAVRKALGVRRIIRVELVGSLL